MANEIYRANEVNLRLQIQAKLNALSAAITAAVSDTAYAASWNGVTTIAPTKNAVYDKIETITSNATHTGEVTGATALTVDKTAISNRSTVTVAATDTILIGDASDSSNLKKIAASDFVASASLAANVATFLATPSSANLAAALTDESNSGVVPFLTSGTFTPTIQDSSFSNSEGQTYTEQTGYYRRMGDVVFYWIDITINSLGTLTVGDAVSIADLPFTCNSSIRCPGYVGRATSLAITAGNALTGYVVLNTKLIAVHKFSATTGTTNLLVSELSTGGQINIAGSYFV